jgi:rare lipoprotein A
MNVIYSGSNIIKVPLIVLSFYILLPVIIFAQKEPRKTAVTTRSNTKKTFYGQASFYANRFNGRRTASGEIFSQKKMTCACNVLAIGTWIRVTNLRNGKSAIVKVNDRLHPSMKRIVDLSSAAAKTIGFSPPTGLTRVKVEVLGKKKPQ